MSGLYNTFPSGLTPLPPRDEEHLKKTPTSTMRSPVLSCWSQFAKRFSKKIKIKITGFCYWHCLVTEIEDMSLLLETSWISETESSEP